MEGYCWPQALTRKHFWESRDALEMRGPFHFCLQKKGPGLYALMVSLSKLFDTLFSCFTWCHDLLCLQFLFLFFKKVSYLIRKETEGGRRYTFSQRMNLRIVSMCQQLWELININYLPISIKTCSGSVTILGSQLYSIWRLRMKQHMNPRPVTFIRPASFMSRGWYLQLYMGFFCLIHHCPPTFYPKTFGGTHLVFKSKII